MVEVEHEGPDNDQMLFDAIEKLIEAKTDLPDEAKTEIRQQVASFEEEMRDHWPSGEMPDDDAECRAGCDFEGSIYRHMARHLTFGAFVMAAQQVNATIAGYEDRLREVAHQMAAAKEDKKERMN